MVDWASVGNLAKEFIFNLPMGVGIGGARAPQWTIASAIKPWTDQQRRAESLTQLKGLGLLTDDIDTSQLAKMDSGLLGTALQLMSKHGNEVKLGDVPGGVEAYFPGVKAPQPTNTYGVMDPSMGEGPTLTQTVNPEEQARYAQISGLTFPRKDIWKTIGEAKGRRANAESLRKFFPEFSDQIPEELSTSELSTARSTFANTRKQQQTETKEQALADAAAKQYGIPPGMPPKLIQEEMLRQRAQKSQDAMMERFNQSQAAIAGRFAQSQAASESRFGRQMGEFDRRQVELEKYRIHGEGRAAIRKAEDDLVRDLDVSIRDSKNRVKDYETIGMLQTPEQKARVAEIQLEIRQMEQRKKQIQQERLKSSPLAVSTGKGGAEEFEDLFK
jgi:hypothetical protein